MAFIPASLMTFIVKEREEQIKHQQIVSGVTVTAYWLSNFFVDMVKHTIPASLCSYMAYVFNIDVNFKF